MALASCAQRGVLVRVLRRSRIGLIQQNMLGTFTDAAHLDYFTNLKSEFREDSSQHNQRKCSTCKKTRVGGCWSLAAFKTCEDCRSKQRARAHLRRNVQRVSNAAVGSCDFKASRHLTSTRFCKSCKRWQQNHDFKAGFKTCGACLLRKMNNRRLWEHEHVSALIRSLGDM